MNWFNKIYSRSVVALQVVMIFVWFICLRETDAFYSIYAMCALSGLIGLWDNRRKKHMVSGWQMAGIGFSAVFFAEMVLFANYRLVTPFSQTWLKAVLLFLGGIVLGWNAMLWLYHRLPLGRCAAEERVHSWRFFWITFGVIAVINLLFLFFVVYPGILTPDSMTQISQIFKEKYTNNHPFWHTMVIRFWIDMGFLLFNDVNAAVALYSVFQIFFMAGCFSYTLKTLYEAGVSKVWIVLAFAVYALTPYNISYSVTMWKDVVFGGAAVVFVTTAYRIIKGLGKNKKLDYVLLTFAAAGLGVWRSNGWLALLVTVMVFAVFLWKSQRRMIILLAAMLVVTWFLKGPLLNAMDIPQPDLVEAMSIPEQQVARVISEGHVLTVEQEELISKIIDIEKVPKLYDCTISDPIKNEIRRTNGTYFEEHKGEYLKLWFEIGLKYPAAYIRAWTDQTRGYWNSGYTYWIYAENVVQNEWGIVQIEGDNLIASLFEQYFTFFEQSRLLNPFKSIGVQVWLVIVLFMSNLLKKRKEALLAIPSLAVVLTLLVATPVFSETRYAYAVFTVCPMLLAVTVNEFLKSQEK